MKEKPASTAEKFKQYLKVDFAGTHYWVEDCVITPRTIVPQKKINPPSLV